jgi:hypothetical protein
MTFAMMLAIAMMATWRLDLAARDQHQQWGRYPRNARLRLIRPRQISAHKLAKYDGRRPSPPRPCYGLANGCDKPPLGANFHDLRRSP